MLCGIFLFLFFLALFTGDIRWIGGGGGGVGGGGFWSKSVI